jgi:hypothetical protein
LSLADSFCGLALPEYLYGNQLLLINPRSLPVMELHWGAGQ